MQLHDNTGTPEQWAQYELDKKEFNKKLGNYQIGFQMALDIAEKKLNMDYAQRAILMKEFDRQIQMMRLMDAPNVPGYLFANND
jgi:hypothetical protein